MIGDTYTLDELDDLEATADNASDGNLRRAVDYMHRVLAANNIKHGLMGGFSLYLRGSRRRTVDVDITVACTMRRLREVIAGQAGTLIRPARALSEAVVRVFLKIPKQGQRQNAQDEHQPAGPTFDLVSIDLILPGALGVPRNLDTAIEQVAVGDWSIPMLNIATMLRSKLYTLQQKGQSQKDMQDITFLIQNYEAEVIRARENVRRDWVQHYVTLLAREAQQDTVRRAMTVLDIQALSPESD